MRIVIRAVVGPVTAAVVIVLAACGGGKQAAPSATPSARPAAASTSPAAVSVTCDSLGGQIQAITADRAAQEKTMAQIGDNLPQSTKDSMAAGAWTDPGTYSGSLDGFMKWVYGVNPVTQSTPSSPAALSGVIVEVGSAGMAVQEDVRSGGVNESDWAAFTAALASLTQVCPGG